MDWSIVEVSRMSGITARTLRHYDAIELLTPSAIGSDGYRRYDEAALLRLQHVLVLRALGLPLKEIGAVLDQDRDEIATLREHRRRLLDERARLGRIAATVQRTIEELTTTEGSRTMTDERAQRLFEGFDEQALAEEARQRWPEQAASSEAYTATLTADDKSGLQQEFADRMARMARLQEAGTPVGDPAVQAEVHDLYTGLTRMWVPDRQSFTGLGRTYVEDERFRTTYDAVAPGLAEYFRDAMARYAQDRLG